MIIVITVKKNNIAWQSARKSKKIIPFLRQLTAKYWRFDKQKVELCDLIWNDEEQLWLWFDGVNGITKSSKTFELKKKFECFLISEFKLSWNIFVPKKFCSFCHLWTKFNFVNSKFECSGHVRYDDDKVKLKIEK